MKIIENVEVTSLLKGVLAGAIAVVVFLYSTFATIKYVDQKHFEAIDHSDANRKSAHEETESLKVILESIKSTLDRLETRTWDMRPALIQAAPISQPQPAVVIKKE